MSRQPRRLAAALVLAAAAGPCFAGLPRLCTHDREPGAGEHDVLLRFGALVKEELEAAGRPAAIVARAGLDLRRLDLRYSHSGLVLKDAGAMAWTVRQLYFACDEGRARVFDQGVTGFLLGADDPSSGWISIVLPPPAESAELARAAVDKGRALAVLGGSYSANAYPFSTRHQNCNQWTVEMLASAWGADDAPGEDTRRRAQAWLYGRDYAPTEFEAASRAQMLAAAGTVPFLHEDDHPPWMLARRRYAVSMPLSIETFVRRVAPAAERVELCHVGRRVVVHHGWDPIPDGCRAGPGDREITLDGG